MPSYPSRHKDPDPVDYSIGSVGIGATAPTLVGDAELDEGAVWEAIMNPSTAELGEVVWIIDSNRQSLDRVVPGIATGRLEAMFTAAGWQVIMVTFGRLLRELFAQPGGSALRTRLLEMPNAEYQRLLRCSPETLRTRRRGGGRGDRAPDRRSRRCHPRPRHQQSRRPRP